MMLNMVLHAYFPSIYLLWSSVYSHLLRIFNGIVCFLIVDFKSALYWYILNTSPLSDMCFADVFSQPMTYLWVLLKVSFTEYMFLILIKHNTLIFFFHGLCFWFVIVSINKNSPQIEGHLDFLLCFLLKVLVLCFTFRSMTHF